MAFDTPADLANMICKRQGYGSPTIPELEAAIDYANITVKEIVTLADWRFLYIVANLTTVAAQRAYSLDEDATYPIDWWDKTNNRSIEVRSPEEIAALDPDENYSSNSLIVAVTGRDSTTGCWTVDLFPTPSTAGQTIRYRYKGTIPDMVSTDTTTTIKHLVPDWCRNAILWGASALYMEQRDDSRAKAEWEKYSTSIQYGMMENQIVGPPPPARIGGERQHNFTINAKIVPGT